MSKELYSMRDTDGALMKFDGSTWAQVGSFVPASWPGGQTVQHQPGVFSYKGNLYTRYMESGGNFRVGKLAAGDVTVVASITALTVSAPWAWSNVVNYRGKAFWTVYENSQLVLYQFDDDGAGSYTINRFNSGLGLTQSPQYNRDGHPDRLIVHDNQLILAPSKLGQLEPDSTSTNIWRVGSLYFRIDFLPGGTVNFAGFDDVNGSPLFYDYWSTSGSGNAGLSAVNSKLGVTRAIAGMFTYKGNLYKVSPTGQVWLINPQTNAHTLKFDIRNASQMAVGTFSPGYAFNSTPQPSMYIRHQSTQAAMFPFLIGSRINFLTGAKAGQSGDIVHAGISTTDRMDLFIVDDSNVMLADNGNLTSDTFSVKRGLAGFGCFSPLAADNTPLLGPTCHIHSYEVGSNVYIIIAGRYASNNSASAANNIPTMIIKWDGVGTTFGAFGTTGLSCTTMQLSGAHIDCMCFDSYLDPEDNRIHMIAQAGLATTMKHFAWNTTTDVIEDFGTAYATTNFTVPTSNNGYTIANNRSFTMDNIQGHNANEGGAIITGVTKNQASTQTTIAGKLFSLDSHALNVKLEYNKGTGWLNATTIVSPGSLNGLASSPTGTAVSIVHAISTDEPSFSGQIQYRLSIT